MTGEDYEARKDEHRPDWPGYKSDHLPECEWNDETRVNRHCICDRLRACEQRVRDEDQRILIKHGAEQFVRGEQIGKAMGYAAGVQDARDAVVEAYNDNGLLSIGHYLQAIDALRGDA